MDTFMLNSEFFSLLFDQLMKMYSVVNKIDMKILYSNIFFDTLKQIGLVFTSHDFLSNAYTAVQKEPKL